jgi:AcrR family transcriptional regulator
MVRILRFTDDAFVEAAIFLVAEGGPSAATIAAIARRVGAPNGSVYHRFASRAAVLATAWAAIHRGFVSGVAPALRAGRGLDAALAIIAWARRDLRHARFLLLNEADSLFDDAPPESLGIEIRRQEDALDLAFRSYLAAVGDPADPELVARCRFLVFDGPIALLRPHLLAGEGIPLWVDRVVTELYDGVAPAAFLQASLEAAI